MRQEVRDMRLMPKHFSNYFQYLEKQDRRTRLTYGVVAFGILLFLVVGITLPFNGILSKYFGKEHSKATSAISSSGDWYWLMLDWANCCPLGNAQYSFNQGMENANSFWQPLNDPNYDYTGFTKNNNLKMALFYPLANRNMPSYGGYTYSQSNIDTHQQIMRDFTSQMPPNSVFWDGMAEFDQGGGDWATGRPWPYSGESKQDYYNVWTNYYLNTLGLGTYLNQTQDQRGYAILSMCDYSSCPHYALEMGANAVMIERNTDELADEAVSIPFVRGAGKQYDKPWGIDYSTYRGLSDTGSAPYGTTTYDSTGKLTSGWDTSFFKRNMYLGYFAGVNITAMEPAVYNYNNDITKPLNPQGLLVKSFGDFVLNRHPKRGKAFVPFALLEDRYAGFDPKYGRYSQGDGTWYLRLPYDSGDYLMNNMLRVAYPDHWTHGTVVPNGPQSPSEYIQDLANGQDPRPWEPMGKTHWGNVFDVLTTNTPQQGLSNYKVVFLTIGYQIDQTLRDKITQFVQNGGTVVMNSSQVTSSDMTLTGDNFGATAQAATAKWLSDGTSYNEPTYNYMKVTPATATVVANDSAGDPVITKNAVGNGFVYLVTPQMMEDANHTQVLNVVQRLMDDFNSKLAPAVVQSSQQSIAYDITSDVDKTVVAIANNDLAGSTWNGTITFPMPSGTYTAKEWVTDTVVPSTVQSGKVVVNVTVPPYDVKVFALQYSPQPSVTPAPLPSGAKVLWPSNPTPQLPETSVGNAIEVGTKFTADVSGVVNGVRFYKGVDNTGTHTGTLWDANGNQLATATFSNETASGWQQVLFSSPVSIQANTTYVVSYHTDTGHYSGDANFFNTGVDNAPLHAPASSAVAGGNGVYLYGAHAFPNQTNAANNYWVDVIFTGAGGGGGTVPSPTPLPTYTPTPLPTSTPIPTATLTPKPTATPTPAATGVNLIKNPGFESGNTSWSTSLSGAYQGKAHTGSWSVRVTGTGGSQTQTIPVVPGAIYTYSGYGETSTTGATGIIGLHILDSSGHTLQDISAGSYITTSSYVKVSKDITMPSNAASVMVYVYKLSGKGYIYGDDLSLVKK